MIAPSSFETCNEQMCSGAYHWVHNRWCTPDRTPCDLQVDWQAVYSCATFEGNQADVSRCDAIPQPDPGLVCLNAVQRLKGLRMSCSQYFEQYANGVYRSPQVIGTAGTQSPRVGFVNSPPVVY